MLIVVVYVVLLETYCCMEC